jgi:hypothetical protein
MAKRSRRASDVEVPVQLPKDALKRVNLGQSFAEYDLVLAKHDVFVRTNALMAADNTTGSKCFFIGRRGTGKTAITKYLVKSPARTALINPEIFSLSSKSGSDWSR